MIDSIKEWGDMGDTKASTTGGEGLLLGDVGAVIVEAASNGGSNIPQGKRGTRRLGHWKEEQIPPRFRNFGERRYAYVITYALCFYIYPFNNFIASKRKK